MFHLNLNAPLPNSVGAEFNRIEVTCKPSGKEQTIAQRQPVCEARKADPHLSVPNQHTKKILAGNNLSTYGNTLPPFSENSHELTICMNTHPVPSKPESMGNEPTRMQGPGAGNLPPGGLTANQMSSANIGSQPLSIALPSSGTY